MQISKEKSIPGDGRALVMFRTFTDIPLSKEMFDALQQEEGETLNSTARASDLIPFFEARYLLTNRILAKQGTRQVLELAAGFSPRGATMTENSSINFLEVDLAEKIRLKKTLVGKLVADKIISERSNLHFLEGNVIDADVFKRAEALLHEDPIVVICEGLLRYLSFTDQEILANHVHRLLQKLGGIWVTPDIELTQYMFVMQEQRDRYEQFAAAGVDVRPNLFADENHATAFFQDLGFAVNSFLLTEVANQLVSPKRLGLSEEKVARALDHRMVFVMTAM
jgi:O-methyltransferase involved in polyketide biosynthesis